MAALRILLIDDDPDDALLTSRVLSAEPRHEVRHITSAAQFAGELKSGDFDAVVLEARVSWSDGLELARTVKAAYPGKAIVLFPRAGSDALFSAALTAGIDGYLAKGSRGFATLSDTVVTAFARASRQARPDEAPFRQLLQKTTTALLFQCSLDGKLLESSGPYAGLPGLSVTDPGAGSFLDRILPADRREIALDRLKQSGSIRLADVPIGRPGTKEVRCVLKAILTKDSDGRAIVTGTLDVAPTPTAAAPAGPKSIAPGPASIAPASIAPGRHLQAVASMERSPREETPALAQRALAAAHDLKEPLRTLVHYSELLKKRYRGQLDADADEYLSFVHEASLRMRTQVSRLFAEAAEVSGGSGRSVDSAAVFDRVVKYLQASIKSTRAEVTHGPLPILPMAEEDLVQILQNLLGNALKFHGETPPRIQVDVTRTGSEWTVSVEDNGLGIAPQDMARLFTMFERGSRSQGIPGTGIGLALCKNIAERNGGRIWAAKNARGGTTFSFTIPASNESGVGEKSAKIATLRPSR